MIHTRFPAARVEVTGNSHGSVWVEVWHGAGHVEAVLLRGGEMGVTVFREELGSNDDPLAPWAVPVPSVCAARFLPGWKRPEPFHSASPPLPHSIADAVPPCCLLGVTDRVVGLGEPMGRPEALHRQDHRQRPRPTSASASILEPAPARRGPGTLPVLRCQLGNCLPVRDKWKGL